MPAISILIPVYNVEKFLEKCIKSVLTQDFQDWEIILVDDGSPDRSGIICDEYAAKDSRIKVIHKENGGLISARREGFVCSSGAYLVFLDSDDTLADGALSILYNSITKGYDVVKGSLMLVNENDECVGIERCLFPNKVVEGYEEVLIKTFIEDIPPYLHTSIYRKELFTKEIFDKGIGAKISFGEDWITNLLISKNINNILCINDVVYKYYKNSDSITRSQVVSMEYFERLNTVLEQEGIIDNSFLEEMVKVRDCRICIRSFFIPEFKFNFRRYKKAYSLLKQDNISAVLRSKIDIKFLRFVKCLPLYYLYSRLYCLLFYVLKLRGVRRKILK